MQQNLLNLTPERDEEGECQIRQHDNLDKKLKTISKPLDFLFNKLLLKGGTFNG